MRNIIATLTAVLIATSAVAQSQWTHIGKGPGYTVEVTEAISLTNGALRFDMRLKASKESRTLIVELKCKDRTVRVLRQDGFDSEFHNPYVLFTSDNPAALAHKAFCK